MQLIILLIIRVSLYPCPSRNPTSRLEFCFSFLSKLVISLIVLDGLRDISTTFDDILEAERKEGNREKKWGSLERYRHRYGVLTARPTCIPSGLLGPR